MKSKRSVSILGFCRIALHQNENEIASCKPMERNGLRPTFKVRSEWLCRNPLQSNRWIPHQAVKSSPRMA